MPTLAYLNTRGALVVAISHPFPPLSTVIIYKKVVCGGLWWFAVVCGGLRWFGMVCGISTVRCLGGEIHKHFVVLFFAYVESRPPIIFATTLHTNTSIFKC